MIGSSPIMPNGYGSDNDGQHRSFPKNIGIIAMDIYFPRSYVSQSKLEEYDGVPPGKYTIGLGQEKMAFCQDNEDIVSLSLTVVSSLMRKYHICHSQIGRLEVGTESSIDRSKSIKSYLMPLFGDNTDILGVDCINACFGGTSAFLNAINWIESRDWDGRFAMVVVSDIAKYEKGPARPTGGAGAIALLIGPNAPIVVERGTIASHSEHVYDFYKPFSDWEYPIVDGQLSIQCYLSALDICYSKYQEKTQARFKEKISLDSFDHLVFHIPYCKLAYKSIARMIYNDFIQIGKVQSVTDENDYKSIEKQVENYIASIWKNKVESTLLASKNLGNLYCASIFAALISLISNSKDENILNDDHHHQSNGIVNNDNINIDCNDNENGNITDRSAISNNRRIGIFSYGSGLCSSFFSIRIIGKLDTIRQITNLKNKLNDRYEVDPKEFDQIMTLMEQFSRKQNDHGYISKTIINDQSLSKGTFYLYSIDKLGKRCYKQKLL